MKTIGQSLLAIAFGIMLGISSISFAAETHSKSSAVNTTAAATTKAPSFLFVLQAKQGQLTPT